MKVCITQHTLDRSKERLGFPKELTERLATTAVTTYVNAYERNGITLPDKFFVNYSEEYEWVVTSQIQGIYVVVTLAPICIWIQRKKQDKLRRQRRK